jgi:hypothetical protein
LDPGAPPQTVQNPSNSNSNSTKSIYPSYFKHAAPNENNEGFPKFRSKYPATMKNAPEHQDRADIFISRNNRPAAYTEPVKLDQFDGRDYEDIHTRSEVKSSHDRRPVTIFYQHLSRSLKNFNDYKADLDFKNHVVSSGSQTYGDSFRDSGAQFSRSRKIKHLLPIQGDGIAGKFHTSEPGNLTNSTAEGVINTTFHLHVGIASQDKGGTYTCSPRGGDNATISVRVRPRESNYKSVLNFIPNPVCIKSKKYN